MTEITEIEAVYIHMYTYKHLPYVGCSRQLHTIPYIVKIPLGWRTYYVVVPTLPSMTYSTSPGLVLPSGVLLQARILTTAPGWYLS